MNTQLFSAFLLLTIILVLTPGPIVTLVLATSATRGVRAGLITVAGSLNVVSSTLVTSCPSLEK